MPNKQATAKLARQYSTSSPVYKNCFRAFWVGGAICALGETFYHIFRRVGMGGRSASTMVTVSLIFLSALVTGLGLFDKIGKYAGAGTLVPVVGFANAVVSPAIDCKSEGLILGVGSKIFSVAGPVLLYSTLCGGIWGVVYYLLYLGGIVS